MANLTNSQVMSPSTTELQPPEAIATSLTDAVNLPLGPFPHSGVATDPQVVNTDDEVESASKVPPVWVAPRHSGPQCFQ